MTKRLERDTDIPGPDVLRARELLSIVAPLDGRHAPSVRVPVLTPGLSAMWLKLVSRADYALARELVLGLTEDLAELNRNIVGTIEVIASFE